MVLRIILFIFLVAALTGTTILVFHSSAARPNSIASVPPGMFQATEDQWSSLEFAQAQQKTFHTTVTTDGKIANDDDTASSVFSPYTGRIIKIFVKAGDHVERGAPLMAVAAPDYSNARAQLKLASENEKRLHALYEAKTVALKDWQQAVADLETAQGNFRTAGSEQAAMRERLHAMGRSDDEIALLESDAIVTAPIGGVVLQRQVGVGQYINSAAGGASNPAFSIGNVSKVWLLANVREADAASMHVGDSVDVQVFACPGRTFTAKLNYVAAAMDPATHRLPVRAEIDNADGVLKPEMFARFTINTTDNEPAVSIPERAIIHEGDDAHVWVADEAHKWLALRQIRLGRSSDGETEVLAGLKSGEKMVTSGSLFIDRAAQSDDGNTSQAAGDDNQKKQTDKTP